MILAIDIGNTNIVLGCVEQGNIISTARMNTDIHKTEYEYAVAMREILCFRGVDCASFEGAILSSVVSQLTDVMKKAIRMLIGKPVLVVGKGIKTGLDMRIDDPGQVGADLVVGAVACLALYTPPLIFIDMGTATKLFALNEKGQFVGGVIAPGLRISMEALSGGTSQLPHISLEAPKKCIGTNTVDCMRSGAMLGTAAMLDGMIERMEEELGCRAAVIATGGYASSVIPLCRREIILNEELLLQGLSVLWEKNRRIDRKETAM